MTFKTLLFPVLLFAIGLGSGLGFLLLDSGAPLVLRITLKILPTVMMGTWMILKKVDKTNVAIFAGLVFALAGDATLEITGQTVFILGIVLNMLALVSDIVYFIQSDRRGLWFRALPFLVLVGGVYAFLYPGLGVYQIPVLAYAILYIVFLWRASARLGDKTISPVSQGLCFLAALVLTVSDSLLGISSFNPGTLPFGKYLILSLWWLGLLLLVTTAELKRQSARGQR